jgi:diadenosine tetraphosphate (Ap4A) HIT family hydrolase
MFELHPQLQQDTFELAELSLCKLLLLNDSNYPWLILVPRRTGIKEVYELDVEDQQQLLRESSALGQAMADCFQAEKMNIAALGNIVPQLHIHHIARFSNDPAWPAPVWGAVPAQPYSEQELAQQLNLLNQKVLNNLPCSD